MTGGNLEPSRAQALARTVRSCGAVIVVATYLEALLTATSSLLSALALPANARGNGLLNSAPRLGISYPLAMAVGLSPVLVGVWLTRAWPSGRRHRQLLWVAITACAFFAGTQAMHLGDFTGPTGPAPPDSTSFAWFQASRSLPWLGEVALSIAIAWLACHAFVDLSDGASTWLVGSTAEAPSDEDAGTSHSRLTTPARQALAAIMVGLVLSAAMLIALAIIIRP